MDPIGVMVYGYDQGTAEKIRDHLSTVCERKVELLSGSSREKEKVREILNADEHEIFQEKEDPKVVMFLGFDGPLIHASMDGFPRFEGQMRPIFCTPTEQNMNWTLEELLKDLMEEREYFKNKGA
jgi:hypothetical protein